MRARGVAQLFYNKRYRYCPSIKSRQKENKGNGEDMMDIAKELLLAFATLSTPVPCMFDQEMK